MGLPIPLMRVHASTCIVARPLTSMPPPHHPQQQKLTLAMMEPPPALLQPGAQPQPPPLPSPPSPELLGRVDDDVKEYLLYRGWVVACVCMYDI